jgi:proline iminopeptidase/L-proline amide hydrolase
MHLHRRALLRGLAASAPFATARAQDWTPPPPDREAHIPVRGGRIYARVNGNLDGPTAPVVFVHGGPGGNHASFLPELVLAAERGVILYDQLDSGLSDHPNDPTNWTVERFVSEIDAVRAAFDLRRFHLVGHSWGSTVALEYAARRPAGLASLTLGSPLISTKSWIRSTTADLAKLPPEVARTISANEAAGTTDSPAYDQAMGVFYDRYLGHGALPRYLRDYGAQHHLALNKALYKGMWGSGEIRPTGSLHAYDGEALLPRIATPTLFLCGENDEMTADVLKPLAARVRGARLAVIAGASHGLTASHPAPYMALLRPHFAVNDAPAH